MTNDDPAPLFGSWCKAYAVGLGLFALEVLVLYAFTVAFS
jgi:hypothetical protein